jgi:hypothetical protein
LTLNATVVHVALPTLGPCDACGASAQGTLRTTFLVQDHVGWAHIVELEPVIAACPLVAAGVVVFSHLSKVRIDEHAFRTSTQDLLTCGRRFW